MGNQSKPTNSNIYSNEGYFNQYCWSCHIIGWPKNIQCERCQHFFHIKCMADSELCKDCKTPKIVPKRIDSGDRAMLKLLTEKWFADKNFRCIDDRMKSRPLTQIQSKIDGYDDNVTFLEDIKWAVHKFLATFKSKQYPIEAKNAEKFQQFCVDQLEWLQTCSECYGNASKYPDEHEIMVCKNYHQLVWTRLNNSIYWPSKLLKDDGTKIKVWFFGRNTLADAAPADCMPYSDNTPRSDKKAIASIGFLAALKDADSYIKNLPDLNKIGTAPASMSLSTENNEKIQNHSIVLASSEPPSLNVSAGTQRTPFSTPIGMIAPQIRFRPTIVESTDDGADADGSDQDTSSYEDHTYSTKRISIQTKSNGLSETPRKRKATDSDSDVSMQPKALKARLSAIDPSIYSDITVFNPIFQQTMHQLHSGIKRMETNTIELGAMNKKFQNELIQKNKEWESKLNETVEKCTVDHETEIQRLKTEMTNKSLETEQKLEKRIAELEAENQRLKVEMAKKNVEWEETMKSRTVEHEAEIHRLKNESVKQNFEWETKLKRETDQAVNDVKCKQWCITCKCALEMAYHCSPNCQQLFWKKE